MLKLNYTENGLYMERLMASPELAIAQRVVLAMRLGQFLQVEPGHASFLLSADVSCTGAVGAVTTARVPWKSECHSSR
ncbi:hypothetical protein H6F90_11005 [Trichocoleus sp. FACHB-591]|uniref:hypothetical protein n=1 Tax=Trichocoleus sp. FACHB-591 TaxID=2692872 RepID=UPI001687FC40|nr:hypothetical protein [Trichocoleus sp. FACHB-591]MBD2095683.1 hypothetical protein [Trichocoleus sp. FACHB-591]